MRIGSYTPLIAPVSAAEFPHQRDNKYGSDNVETTFPDITAETAGSAETAEPGKTAASTEAAPAPSSSSHQTTLSLNDPFHPSDRVISERLQNIKPGQSVLVADLLKPRL